MFSITSVSVAFLGVFAVFAVGCAAPSQEEAAGSESALVKPEAEGSFKLYDEGAAQPDSECDVHTVLTFSHKRTDGMLRASLHEAVEGRCRLALDPDPREYRLVLDHTDCGSSVYKASSVARSAKREITITDHRGRTCRDMPAAQIVVEETVGSEARTLQAAY
jgi:hypothetical protein